MAISKANLTTSELANRALDKPILGYCASLATLGTTGARWVALVDGDTTDANISATGYDATFGVDGLPGIVSKPTSQNSHTFVLDWSDNPIEFDFIAFINHNLNTIGATVECDIDTSATFATADDIGLGLTPGDDNRQIDISLLDGGATEQRFTGVKYARLNFTYAAAPQIPQFGQVIFGRSYQLAHQPNNPWDPDHKDSSVDGFTAKSGAVYQTKRFGGRRLVNADLLMSDSTQQSNLVSWYNNTNYGIQPFIWIDLPNSAPGNFHLMLLESPEFSFPYQGPTARSFSISAYEQGDQFLSGES